MKKIFEVQTNSKITTLQLLRFCKDSLILGKQNTMDKVVFVWYLKMRTKKT